MNTTLIACALSLACACAVSADEGGHGEIYAARTTAGELVPHMHFDQPVVVPRSDFPGITGFATGAIGFESLPLDDADEGIFTLSPACSLNVRLIAVDAGAVIYNGFPVLGVGESMVLGPPAFDHHPVFSISSPAAVPGTPYTFRFLFHDSNGVYTDSEEFTLAITPACPADHNLSGGAVSVQDIFDFLGDYFANFPQADFNHTGGLTVQDIFDFLEAYFTPCP